jgi:hypothetical protein
VKLFVRGWPAALRDLAFLGLASAVMGAVIGTELQVTAL